MPDEPIPPTSEPPQFLARTGRHGTYKKLPRTSPTDAGRWVYVEADEAVADLGYTTSTFRALNHEPECVGPAILDNYVDINRRMLLQQHILDVAEAQTHRSDVTPQNRLDTVYQRARHAHVDLSHPIHLVQKEIDKARLRERPASPRALARLEGLEALLDGVSIKRLAA